jgi:flagellar basal-body rod modification protein FlgD
MQVNPLLTSTLIPMTGAAGTSGSTSPTTGNTNSNPLQDTDSMFMQLLTAQLQNQSPLDPVDPMQFTSQLVQFNMLDQLAQINQTLQNAFPSSGTTPTSSSTTSPGVQGAH